MYSGRCWIVSAVACALALPAGGSRASPETAPPGTTSCFISKIAVQADVSVKQLPMRGPARDVPEWSQGAWDHVQAALEDELGTIDHVLVDPRYPAPTTALLVDDDDEEEDENDAEASPTPPTNGSVAPPSLVSIATHPSQFMALMRSLHEAKRRPPHGMPLMDWLDEPVDGNMSPKLRQYFVDLASASGARCVLVVNASRSYPTKGIRTTQVLLVPLVYAMGGLGLSDSGARKSASAYLIDPELGVVIWHIRLSRGVGDLRDASGASKTIRRLLADLPAREPTP